MIISHKHKFIFIKTAKTAGTSIEIALSEFCGEKDIITLISPEDEKVRKNLGFKGPQNYNIPFNKLSKREKFNFLLTRKRPNFYNHISASLVQKFIPPDVWNSYYKFAFERNPWDKVVSWYFWRYKSEPRPNLSDFVHSSEANIIKGFELYTKNAEIILDDIFLYENLENSMIEISEKLKLNKAINLPKTKTKFRKEKNNYQDILSSADQEKVAQVYAREIAFFNYQF